MRLIRSRKFSDAAAVRNGSPADALLRTDVASGAVFPDQLPTVPESKYLSDEDVWRAFQNGEDAAFNMLYARYSDRLYAYLRFLLIGSPRHLDDIFQEAWITVFKCRNDEEPTSLNSFSGWLFRVAHNLA